VHNLLKIKSFKNIAIVSHGGTSQLLLEILLNNSKGITEPDNCSTTRVKIEKGKTRLIEFNDISYL
jgi:broad specificity phosphatase PhoE